MQIAINENVYFIFIYYTDLYTDLLSDLFIIYYQIYIILFIIYIQIYEFLGRFLHIIAMYTIVLQPNASSNTNTFSHEISC